MPKKTKRQKMAAETRKHRLIEHHVEAEKVISPTPIQPHIPKVPKKTFLSTTSTVVFKQELIKSLLISGFLLVIELSIYIAQQNGLSFNINLPF